MKLGIVVYTNDPETVWNAFRLGTFALNKEDSIKIFLLGKGVESELLDTGQFQITKEMRKFIEAGGEILACGTCLNIRQSEGSEMCPISSMSDLYQIIKESDRVLTF